MTKHAPILPIVLVAVDLLDAYHFEAAHDVWHRAIVTVRSPDRARGYLAQRIEVTPLAVQHRALPDLLAQVVPCTVTADRRPTPLDVALTLRRLRIRG